MTTKRMIFGGVVVAAMAVAVAAPPGIASSSQEGSSGMEEMSMAEIIAARQDSIAAALEAQHRANVDRINDDAAEQYKKVKFMLFEGELESNLYPAALKSNTAAMTLLDSAYNDTQQQRARDILTDLNSVMMHGAVYFSGKGNTADMIRCAQAYIDTQMHPLMADAKFERPGNLFPQLAYQAAFGATQSGDTQAAKRYFEAYLSSDDMAQRQNVIKYYGQACLATGDYIKGFEALNLGVMRYPTDMQMLTLALQTCLDGGLTDRMQPLLDKALALDPHDEKLLKLQAQLYERNQDYSSALDIWNRLAQEHPNSLEVHQSIATCYYNLGASHYNSSIMEADDKVASRHRRQSKSYFQSAATALGHVLANTPSDMKYLRALAHTYAAMGEREKFDEVNRQISGFGGQTITFNSMPALIGTSNAGSSGAMAAVKVPTYEEFAGPYIAKHIAQWAQRGEFEKMEDFEKRVAGETETLYNTLNKQAEEEYLKTYARQLVISDLKRYDYDIDNEVYKIDTPYGSTYVKVPAAKHEAEAFKAGWETAQIRAPKFIIRNNRVALGEITYVVNGKKYTYNADDMQSYQTPFVYVDINSILGGKKGGDDSMANNSGAGSNDVVIGKKSDVDENIPLTGRKAENVYALIVANQQYQKADDVFGALHDGQTFREYCVKTLGLPESQVTLLRNATGNQVRDALTTLTRRVKSNPGSEVIFYYAGHGLPDDATKEAFMMPVDANPLVMSTLIPMQEVYGALGDMNAAATSVFVDACFSGVGRDGSALKEGRAVQIKAKEVIPEGNMYVLTAASAQETALPYKDKNHGLFTYFLLKKLQESKGNASLKEISDYVISSVKKASYEVNGKPQNPTVHVSGTLSKTWEKKKLKP